MNDELFLDKLSEISKIARVEMTDASEITPAEWDSVELLDLIAAIDDAYGVTISTESLNGAGTVGELRSLISAARAS
jgi:acyl carrier protein